MYPFKSLELNYKNIWCFEYRHLLLGYHQFFTIIAAILISTTQDLDLKKLLQSVVKRMNLNQIKTNIHNLIDFITLAVTRTTFDLTPQFATEYILDNTLVFLPVIILVVTRVDDVSKKLMSVFLAVVTELIGE